jgi:hypothetical protein
VPLVASAVPLLATSSFPFRASPSPSAGCSRASSGANHPISGHMNGSCGWCDLNGSTHTDRPRFTKFEPLMRWLKYERVLSCSPFGHLSSLASGTKDVRKQLPCPKPSPTISAATPRQSRHLHSWSMLPSLVSSGSCVPRTSFSCRRLCHR